MSIPGSASPLFFQTAAAAAAFSVNRSLRFNSADSAYLNKTFSSAGNRKTYTISFWVKSSNHDDGASVGFGGGQIFSAGTSGSGARTSIGFPGSSGGSNQDKFVVAHNATGSTWATLSSNAVFKDFSAWQHFVVAVDCTQGTASDRVKVYVNGSQITMSGTYPSNEDQPFNNNVGHAIGRYNAEGKDYFNGYIAEFNFIDGSQLAATDFGEYDDNNNWNPKEFTGTYGSNGFRLNFDDNTSTTTIAEDSSGNNNDFTANNISVIAGSGNDSLFDAPVNGSQSDTGAGGEVSGNYATLNPLHKGSSVVLANGNLNVTASSGTSGVGSTIGMSSGKFFCEVTVNNVGDETKIGIGKEDALKSEAGSTATTWAYINIGDKMNSNINTSYGSSFTTGDVVGIAFDADGGNLYFYKNGVAQNSGTAAYTGLTSGPYFFHVTARYISTANDLSLNFGQRAFAYSAPSGYKALCTANLSDPTIADGSTAMDVVTYTGNGTTRSITSLSFSPDWLWFKTRNTSRENYVYDILRGVQRPIYPDLSNQAETGPDTDAVSSFDSNGWTMGGDPGGNNNNDTYVCWTWDAGSSTVSNTDGSITANVRANASAGFSIIQFLGNATSGATVGHGLNAAPELVIGKNRGGGDAWWVWFKAISSNASAFLKLGTTGLKTSTQYIANNTAPSSTVITLGSDYGWNSNQSPGSILYAFTPVSGYSAFGEYTGATDLFIYTGFKPQWLMLKSYAGDGFNWVIIDDARGADSSNVSNKLYPNLSGAEDSDARGTETKVVFLSNGFLFLDSGAETNSSSRSYVYAAFASHPINTSRGGFQNIP